MKPPPLLLGVGLVFWGWQTDLLLLGLLMGVIIESARVVHLRWDLTDEDFSRIWTFCALLLLAAAVYAFAATEGPTNFTTMFSHPNLRTERGAGVSTAKTMALIIRWLPMIFFLFVAAQTFSTRGGVPLQVISLIMRRRWRKAKQLGQKLPYARSIDISYPYLALCLAAAAVHSGEDNSYYWGFCILIAWGLWGQRSWRYGLPVWVGSIGLAIVLGYYGQGSIARLQHYVDSLNPSWLSAFTAQGFDVRTSRTAMGQIGRIKASPKIVIRLEVKEQSRAPVLLREATYRTYKAETWYAGSSINDFENILSETNNTSWNVLRARTNANQRVNIACYLPGGLALLPLPEGTARLENCAAYLLQKNSGGAVKAQGPGLLIFDALYGPGETIDSAPDPKEDLFVPPREADTLKQVISELHLSDQDPNALKAIGGFFAEKFSYSTWQEPRGKSNTNDTLLGRFLLNTRKGHCEYFATATVLLLRELKIPARYAVGYAVHESSGNKYIVRQRDAHAWCRVWNADKKLWEDFDTTPASWLAAESNFSSLRQFLSDFWSGLRFQFAKIRWGQTHLRQYILWGLLPVLGLLLFRIIFRTRRQRQSKKKAAAQSKAWPGLDSEFYVIEKALAQRGLSRERGEPLSHWLFRASSDDRVARMQDRLRNLLRLHYRYRFDPQGLNVAERNALRDQVAACLRSFGWR